MDEDGIEESEDYCEDEDGNEERWIMIGFSG